MDLDVNFMNIKKLFSTLLVACVSLSIVFAQIDDDFSDGDFINNPTWVGDSAWFEVNAANELQSNNAVINDTISLTTPNTLINDIEWKMNVRLGFAPSDNNFIKIYLVSDQLDLKGSLNGYYIRLGENGTNDALKFYRQDGTTSTLLMTGALGTIATNPNVSLKVTRDAAGNWTVSADFAGGAAYVQDMTFTDNTYTSTAHFGFWIKHTTTNNNKHYFDNIYVGAPVVDATPPVLLSATPLSALDVDALFDEPLEVISAETILNYSLNNGIGNPVSAIQDATNKALVHLSFGSSFVTNTYTLTVTDVQDVNNNVATNPQTANFPYVLFSQANFKDIIFNEIMADPNPVVGLPAVEFVELYNNSTKSVDLTGWKLKDASTSVGTVGSGFLLPGEYAILTSTTNVGLFTGKVVGVSSFPSLNDAGDNLGIRNGNGDLIDTVAYKNTWYNDAVKANGGWTLELINPNPICASALNWNASLALNGGTPGAQNSIYSTSPDITPPTILSGDILTDTTFLICFDEVMNTTTLGTPANFTMSGGIGVPSSVVVAPDEMCVTLTYPTPLSQGVTYILSMQNQSDCSGNPLAAPTTLSFIIGSNAAYKNIVINEILADPTPQIGLPNAEYVELYNPSTLTINLNGWTFTDGSTKATLGNYVLLPNEYLILTPTASASLFTGNVLGVSNFPSLNNAGDNLGLRSSSGVLIDTVSYSIAWYNDAIKDDGGWSLELINPLSPCGAAANWGASVSATGGTPGVENSIFSVVPDVTPPAILSTEIIGNDTISICFDEGMQEAPLVNVANYTFSNGLGNPAQVIVTGQGNQCILLVLNASIVPGVAYELSIANMSDCVGNIPPTPLIASVVKGLIPQPGEVVITEIFPDYSPSNGLPAAEFVEIYNRTNKVVDISGWQVRDPSTTAVIENTALLPYEYAVMCIVANKSLFTSYGKVITTTSFPSLNNDKDTLYLEDNFGFISDVVAYDDTWYRDDTKKLGGWTLERIDADFTNCNNNENWNASTNAIGGTPAAANSVKGAFTDNKAPTVMGIEVMNNLEVKVYFSEAMDNTTLIDASHYSVDNGIGNPSVVVPTQPTRAAVTLILNAPLQPQVLYNLAISGVTDCAGNPLQTTVLFGEAQPVAKGDVVLSEVLFNPYTGGNDFVEIYNGSTKVLDLRQLFLAESVIGVDGKDSIYNKKAISDQQILLLPQSYVCLTTDIDALKTLYAAPANASFYQVSSLPSYDDTEGGVVLLTATDTLETLYYDKSDLSQPAFVEGVAWEKELNPANAHEPTWHTAAQYAKYATPGYKNSRVGTTPFTNGEVLINEILFNPVTGGMDYVEIYNNSQNPVNLSNLRLARRNKDETTYSSIVHLFGDRDSLLPGQLVCLTEDVAFQTSQYMPSQSVNAQFMEMKDVPTYDDKEGEVAIFTWENIDMDKFYYKDSYHFAGLSDKNGVSLERISLVVPASQADNWHSAASNVNYGTPGYKNSQSDTYGAGTEVFVENEVFTPNGDGDNDVLPIQYQFGFSGANARVNIYDSQGRMVRTLQRNELLGTAPGVINWDGADDAGNRVLMGLYVIVFEVQNQNTGSKKTYKLACVVADKF